MKQRISIILLFTCLAGAYFFYDPYIANFYKRYETDLPWTRLDLSKPIGLSTRMKLVALRDDLNQCETLLEEAGIHYQRLPSRGGAECLANDLIKTLPSEPLVSKLTPPNVAPACSVVAAYVVWEQQIVQTAALEFFQQPVTGIEHYGSYNCRRMYGQANGRWSQHATGNAIDIAGFILKNGERISIKRDWKNAGQKSNFLKAIRDGACDVYATVLSPEYNAAHADHFHFDQAQRGKTGWGVCR